MIEKIDNLTIEDVEVAIAEQHFEIDVAESEIEEFEYDFAINYICKHTNLSYKEAEEWWMETLLKFSIQNRML